MSLLKSLLNPGIDEESLGQMCIKHWAMMHGLVGLLGDIEADPEIDSSAGNAIAVVKNDLRSFLVKSIEF